jgi:hypothetical protein
MSGVENVRVASDWLNGGKSRRKEMTASWIAGIAKGVNRCVAMKSDERGLAQAGQKSPEGLKRVGEFLLTVERAEFWRDSRRKAGKGVCRARSQNSAEEGVERQGGNGGTEEGP